MTSAMMSSTFTTTTHATHLSSRRGGGVRRSSSSSSSSSSAAGAGGCNRRVTPATVTVTVSASSARDESTSDYPTSTGSGRRALLGGATLTAAASTFINLGVAPMAQALYNKDLDVPITDPEQAVATVFAVRNSIKDVLAQIEDFGETCPAPVFPCDLSQLSVKMAGGRCASLNPVDPWL